MKSEIKSTDPFVIIKSILNKFRIETTFLGEKVKGNHIDIEFLGESFEKYFDIYWTELNSYDKQATQDGVNRIFALILFDLCEVFNHFIPYDKNSKKLIVTGTYDRSSYFKECKISIVIDKGEVFYSKLEAIYK